MRRSWWGWGYVEHAVTGAEAAELCGRVTALLPDADLSQHDAPDANIFAITTNRAHVPASLEGIASEDPVDRLAHAHGQAFRDVVRALLGRLDHVPDVVLRPRDERELADALDWCSREGVAVIPFGGGTSVVGGVEPRVGDGYRASASLDLGAMSRVLEIDEVSRAASVQAGTCGPDLEAQLKPHGMTLRFFPQSFELSTVGGWLATRAGGHYATALTHIDDVVESLRVVTPAGIVESRRLPASGAGPSPDRMFLGSEGTLGVITQAWLRLQPRPRWRAGASVAFADYADGVRAVRAIAQSGLAPANCRLLDPVEAFLNAASPTSLLVLGFESADHPVRPAMERALELCGDHGGSPAEEPAYTDDAELRATRGAANTWRSAFLRMPYQRDALASRGMIVETFETACTWDRFNELRAAVHEAAQQAMATVGARGVLSCRFTHVYPDGPAPYFGVYAAGRWGSTVEQWDDIKAAVSEAILCHGGTITHHHAIGRDHRPWYDRQRPDLFAAALSAGKRVLDPAGVMNPGVLLAAPE